MGQHLESMLASARRTRGLAEKMVVGIGASIAARKPAFERDGKPVLVDTNHASFVMGHLSLYPSRVLANFGLDAGGASCPAEWTDLYKAGAPCIDDVSGTIYSPFETLTSHYFVATDLCLTRLSAVGDERLAEAPIDERMRANFATLGQVAVFMLNNHVMLHLGQLSAWRRCFGLPSAL